MSDKRKPNRLIGEKSPYLIKHAYNPVDWYVWGGEAFEKAKKENKPIFLSIGYSTCHWCTVMERESFENEDIAALLNEKFVSIKVDREERPDIDEVYMKAVMAMTGQGGWPLSVFLTPDLKPFYGGTYFPPVSGRGMPAFPDVLNFVADLWKNKREEVVNNSEELVKHVQHAYVVHGKGTLSKDILDSAFVELIGAHDEQFGGFSPAPKFPLPNLLEFLLRYYARTRKDLAMRAVTKTLTSMAAGGIHDQLGGGFHRYSTDRYWLIPHFEKMLYDNALLARVYLEAYQLTRDPGLRAAATDTLGWILSEMTDKEGGFYSAQDADTADGEGYYYSWTPAEVERVLGKEDAAVFDDLFGVTEDGNFEGKRSILHLAASAKAIASRFNLSQERLERLVSAGKEELLAERRLRAKPAVDDKVLTSWNGLAISAFAYGYTVTGEEKYLEAGKKCANFLLRNLIVDGKLLRRYRTGDVAIDGSLEDYAFLGAALLDLYETTFDPTWLKEAITLTDKMVGLFWDGEAGGFFMSSSQQVIARIKESYDGPTPSGNSVAVLLLLRLSEFTGRKDLREKADRTLNLFAELMETSPSAHTAMVSALDFWLGAKEIVVTGPVSDDTFTEMLGEIRKRFLPNKVLAFADEKVGEIRVLTEGKSGVAGRPTVYICQNFACQAPTTQVTALAKQLDA